MRYFIIRNVKSHSFSHDFFITFIYHEHKNSARHFWLTEASGTWKSIINEIHHTSCLVIPLIRILSSKKKKKQRTPKGKSILIIYKSFLPIADRKQHQTTSSITASLNSILYTSHEYHSPHAPQYNPPPSPPSQHTYLLQPPKSPDMKAHTLYNTHELPLFFLYSNTGGGEEQNCHGSY